MDPNEEALVALYTQRSEILKQLADVDAKIKTTEAQLSEQHRKKSWSPPAEDAGDSSKTPSSTIEEKAAGIVSRCMESAGGLREAIKAVAVLEDWQRAATTADEAEPKKPSTAHREAFRSTIIAHSLRHSVDLATDPNGSEFLYNLCGVLRSDAAASSFPCKDDGADNSESELMQLIRSFGDRFHSVCCSTNGARVTQRIIEELYSTREFDLLSSVIAPRVVELAKDINGNHTLTKLITATRFKGLEQAPSVGTATVEEVEAIYNNIFEELSKCCIETCRNRQGCCTIQKCLQWAPEPYYEQILSAVLSNTLKLVQDPFANYVIQYILDQQGELKRGGDGETADYTNQIIRQMLHHVADLSCNKFSSNVVEKCLKLSSVDVRQLLVDELTDPAVLPKLLTDSFANYVIQTAIVSASDDAQFTQIREAIMPLQGLLKNSPYGVKIETKLARRMRDNIRKQPKKRDGNHHHHHRGASSAAMYQNGGSVSGGGRSGPKGYRPQQPHPNQNGGNHNSLHNGPVTGGNVAAGEMGAFHVHNGGAAGKTDGGQFSQMADMQHLQGGSSGPDQYLAQPIFGNVSAVQVLSSNNDAMGIAQPMQFSNWQPGMTGMFQQQQVVTPMPFVFGNQQQMFGLQNNQAHPNTFPMGVLNGGMNGTQQQQ